MNFFKSIFKNKATRIWFIVTVAVLVLIIAVDIVGALLSSGIDLLLGGSRPIIGERVLTITKEEALEAGYGLSEEIAEEGFVLLKNDSGVLPLAASETKISVFGKNSVNLVYGSSGSGGKSGLSGVKTIFESLTAAGYTYNPKLKSFYENNNSISSGGSGSVRSSSPSMKTSGVPSLNTGETPITGYPDDVKSSYSEYKDVALVVLSRIGGEGWDLPRAKGHENPNSPDDHYLQLDKNEADLLKAVCAEGFTKVIVVLNSNNPMELGFLDDPAHYAYDSRINGCIWIGTPGDTGIMALGRLLKGDVSPSGRTVDTYSRDFTKDPVWVNFGDMNKASGQEYLVGTANAGPTYTYVDYEEDIYAGYRYFETRGFEELKKDPSSTWYKDNVVYPFGYGKSYAEFSQEFSQKPSNLSLSDSSFSVTVKVTNTSGTFTKPAKDAVQIYVTPPYGDTAKVEKSHVALTAFAKTKAIAPGAANADEVEIKIDPYLFASYDEKTDGGCFVLEPGSYVFKLGKSAHDFYADTFTMNVGSLIKFKSGADDDIKNRFSDAAGGLQTKLSRSNFTSTMPQARTDEQRQLGSELKAKLDDRTPNNPIIDSPPAYPDVNIESDLLLLDMVTVAYDDPKWDTFIQMLTIKELTKLATDGQFKTESVSRSGSVVIPATICTDGPYGFVNFVSIAGYDSKVYYPSEVVIASTWNQKLAEKFGQCVGDEALIGNGNMPISGWYAPGVNIHRSPFGGRVSEYFSEDPLLCGMMGAGVVKGARDKGIMTFVKHFAVNEQETSRQCISTWLSEQALREIYLRPFELTVKEGKTLAIMSSFNRIGTKWTGGDYRLLTEVLRKEWGFEGMVVCDYFEDTAYANTKQMIYAGGDLHLIGGLSSNWFTPSNSDAADITVLQTATKNILFAVSRSNITGVVIEGYRMAVWNIVLIVVNVVLVTGLLAWGALVIIRMIKSEKKKKVS